MSLSEARRSAFYSSLVGEITDVLYPSTGKTLLSRSPSQSDANSQRFFPKANGSFAVENQI